MRIRTIQRNTNFLSKTLQGISEVGQNTLEEEMLILVARSKKIKKKRDEVIQVNLVKNVHDQSHCLNLDKSRSYVNNAIENKLSTLKTLLAHRSDIHNQILNQSDMAIRKLLLELETGGNIRFEDEQKEDAWVADCEALVKMFIKRAASKTSPRTIQIHRISRLHNRHMKLKFEVHIKIMLH